ncbi:MAG: ParA family protein [Acidiphilium sp.]|nr:ParA family protein [Acidiphilium sp.]
MKVIAVAVAKGGVGKSMLTRSLSTAGGISGLNVLVLDMDSQQTTTQWSRRRRPDEMPIVKFSTENDLGGELTRAKAAGCDVVFIDTPPARSSEAPAAIESADFVLIPSTADIEAFEQLHRTLRLARTCGVEASAVLNLATPNSVSEIDTARDVFKSIGLDMAPAVLHRYKLHREAARLGRTAQEIDPTSKAAAEIDTLWLWVAARLHLGTSANVHGGRAA